MMLSTSRVAWKPGFIIIALSLVACSGGASVAPGLSVENGTPAVTSQQRVSGATSSLSGVEGQVISVSPTSLAFASPTAAAQSITASENFAGTVSASGGTCATVSPASQEVAVTPGSGGIKTATFSVAPLAAGSCTVTLTDKKGNSAIVAVTVSVREFAYVANQNSNNVSAYTVDVASGALTRVAGSPFATGSSPIGVTVDPTGKFVYVANWHSYNVSAYTINASSGALTPVAGSPFAAGTEPQGVTVDPTGKFLYVPNASSSDVSAYAINAITGALTPVAGSPFADRGVPRTAAIDPTGKFVFVATPSWACCPEDNGIRAYAIDATSGALTPVTGSPFASGAIPQRIAVDPTGKFAYAVNWGDSTVSEYTINATDGALTPSGTFGAGVNPNDVRVDPTGKFAYVANGYSGNVSAYTINAINGVLSPVAGSPFAAAAGFVTAGVAVDPTGKFVYVTNIGGGNSVSAYSINTTSGALTPVAGSPFATRGRPIAIVLTRPR